MTLELRLEYLARAIMSAKSCNLRTAGSGEGEFLHELKEKLEVARIQMQVYQALVKLNGSNPSRRIDQALAGLNSQLLDVTTVRDYFILYKSFSSGYQTASACDFTFVVIRTLCLILIVFFFLFDAYFLLQNHLHIYACYWSWKPQAIFFFKV